MVKIVHIADTHIRCYDYHNEYRKIFLKMFSILEKEKPDCIIHCGDIAHHKTRLSPEFVDLACFFLKGLAKIAPLYLIAGNHDGNLKNKTRMDSIEPLVCAINDNNIKYLKKSGEYKFNDDITLNVLSIFDVDNWVQPTDKNKINIALYHGSISGCDTDANWTMANGDNDISIFKNFDYGFVGDIHKTFQGMRYKEVEKIIDENELQKYLDDGWEIVD